MFSVLAYIFLMSRNMYLNNLRIDDMVFEGKTLDDCEAKLKSLEKPLEASTKFPLPPSSVQSGMLISESLLDLHVAYLRCRPSRKP